MKPEIEEIRKYWINPETKRAWDIFASSSEALYTAKIDIPALLSALEAAQEENRRLREALNKLYELVLHEVDYKTFENGVTDASGLIDEGRVRACETIEAARLALARPEKDAKNESPSPGWFLEGE